METLRSLRLCGELYIVSWCPWCPWCPWWFRLVDRTHKRSSMDTRTKFTASPYAGEADLQPICDLINLCNKVDELKDETYANPDDIRVWLSSPDIADKARDIRLWRDAQGRLVGFAVQRVAREPDEEGKVDTYLYFRVHPEVRNGGLED